MPMQTCRLQRTDENVIWEMPFLYLELSRWGHIILYQQHRDITLQTWIKLWINRHDMATSWRKWIKELQISTSLIRIKETKISICHNKSTNKSLKCNKSKLLCLIMKMGNYKSTVARPTFRPRGRIMLKSKYLVLIKAKNKRTLHSWNRNKWCVRAFANLKITSLD